MTAFACSLRVGWSAMFCSLIFDLVAQHNVLLTGARLRAAVFSEWLDVHVMVASR